MVSRKGAHCIMADLGKVEKILRALEILPECNGCTTMIRRGRRTIRRIMKNMVRKKEFKVNWSLVEQVIQIISRLITLINLERLKGYFNNCKCFSELIYGCCLKAWQAIKDDPNCCWSQAKGSRQRIRHTCTIVVYV